MEKVRIIDDKDRNILNIIQKDARIQNVDIAREMHLAPSAVLGRIRRLEKDGVIQAFETKINANAVGLSLTVFLFITTEEAVGETGVAKSIARIPEVQEVHMLAGEDCYLVKLKVANPQELATLLRKRFGAFKSIRSTRTTIVLDTFKETSNLPLPGGQAIKRK
jgi:Lrp/AsnC family leucine-responsive transcriptional regulator